MGGAGVAGGEGRNPAAGGEPPGGPRASSKSTECCALSAAPILTSCNSPMKVQHIINKIE